MATSHVSVGEAKRQLEKLLQKVEQGAKIVITRVGRAPVELRLRRTSEETSDSLPSLKRWREEIEVRGGLSDMVVEKRDEERCCGGRAVVCHDLQRCNQLRDRAGTGRVEFGVAGGGLKV